MIFIIILLIFLSFLQASVSPVNLVLIAIIARSFIVSGQTNFWLAFSFGLLLSFLLGYPLGSLSLVFIAIVSCATLFRGTHFASSLFALLPLSFVLLTFDHLVQGFLNHSSLDIGIVFLETFLAVPVYLLVRGWEERFIPKKDIRLKVGG